MLAIKGFEWSRVVKYVDYSPIVISTSTAFQINGKIKLEYRLV
jgi:hypothetical protein